VTPFQPCWTKWNISVTVSATKPDCQHRASLIANNERFPLHRLLPEFAHRDATGDNDLSISDKAMEKTPLGSLLQCCAVVSFGSSQ